MPSNCPRAPAPDPNLTLQIEGLPARTRLVRFHGAASRHTATSFNPNVGKDWTIPEHGTRFNPFPDPDTGVNVPHLYCADCFSAAALESVFHDVAHSPDQKVLRSQLSAWNYTELEVVKDITLFRLANPQLRQLRIPGRLASLNESEVIHSLGDEYPHTRTWAQYVYASDHRVEGLAWRPRLADSGLSFIFFGTRCGPGFLKIVDGPNTIDSGPGFDLIEKVATLASIAIVSSLPSVS